MKILITGATGLIGSHLSETLIERGHIIHYLTTRKSKITQSDVLKGYYWNASEGSIDTACLEGVEIIVHLAGASIAQRWTAANREKILKSRTETTSLLYDLVANHTNSVRHFVSASGIGIYPPSQETEYTESSQDVDSSFVGDVVVAWEHEAMRFQSLDIKTTLIRTGLVLAGEGGALPKIAAPIRKGFGAPIGTGKQWQSWIHIDDMTAIYEAVIDKQWEGVINAVAPNPVTNKALTQSIARSLNRKLWLPNVPGFVLKLILGRMANLVLQGQLVRSERLSELDFVFNFEEIDEAIDDLLH